MEPYTLRKVIYIGRHGMRAPLKIPEDYAKEWKQAGALTVKGAASQYEKGKTLREKYFHFLSSLKETQVLVRTSNLDRTIDSAFSLTQGLLGLEYRAPDAVAKKEKTAFLKKFGARFLKPTGDIFFRGFAASMCPALYDSYGELIEKHLEQKSHFEELLPLNIYANRISPLDTSFPVDYYGMFNLYDFLICYQADGRAIPEEFSDPAIFSALKNIHFFINNDLMFASEKARRLTNHYLFRELHKILCQEEATFHYYSSHDSNIFSAIVGLKYNIQEMPNFSTGLIIELHSDKSVHVEYNGDSLNVFICPSELLNPFGRVPLAHFLALLDQECFESDKEFVLKSGNPDFDYVRDYINGEDTE